MKGMELQETSCHNLEATRIDEIFQKTFDQVDHINIFFSFEIFDRRFLSYTNITKWHFLEIY